LPRAHGPRRCDPIPPFRFRRSVFNDERFTDPYSIDQPDREFDAMNAQEAIKLCIDSGDMITKMYLEDLTDAEMLKRPAPNCNHINWQVGHLIASENGLISSVKPGAMPELPAGFADRYKSENATSDDPAKFCTKAQLMAEYKRQREATLAALAKTTDAELAQASKFEWAPTVASIYSMQGSHWLMHAGQWAVVRRQLGRKPLF
jgi:hypothetical protein